MKKYIDYTHFDRDDSLDNLKESIIFKAIDDEIYNTAMALEGVSRIYEESSKYVLGTIPTKYLENNAPWLLSDPLEQLANKEDTGIDITYEDGIDMSVFEA